MHSIFTLMRLYPFWSVPLAAIFVQLGIYFRRRTSSLQWSCFGMAGLLVLTALIWIVGRGDLHSDQWVRAVFG
jgi:hypothetical protein